MGRNHTWSSWRERYKKNSVRFDELIKKIVEQGDHDQTMVYAYDKRPPFEHLVSRGGNDGLGRNREREEEEEEEEEGEEGLHQLWGQLQLVQLVPRPLQLLL